MKIIKVPAASEPHAAAQPAATPVRMIPLPQLRIAPWNARKTFDQGAQAELTESIRTQGIVTPLIVRPFPESEWKSLDEDTAKDAGELFEIVTGHRRHAAALALGLPWAPAMVRELADDEARELGLVDNLQREDVPAMEEAVAFEELLKRLGSIAAVAARVNKEQGYVAKRLRLCSLALCSQDALREQLITIDHALLLARLGAGEQDEALKWCLGRNAGSKTPVEKVLEERLERRKQRAEDHADDPDSWRYAPEWEPETVQRLKEHIAQDGGTPLSRAPWGLADGSLLDEVPACDACPQNTSANAPLFGDLAIGEPRCTDGACFKEKTQAFVEICQRNAGMMHGVALRVSWKQTSTPPRLDKETGKPSLTQTFKNGQWEEATKRCEYVRPAVTVDWSDANNRGYMGREDKLRKPGEIVQVCIEPKCKVHAKAYERVSKSASSQAGDDPKKRAEEEERKKQAAIAENKIRMLVVSAALEKVKKLPPEYLRELLADQVAHWGDSERVVNAIMPGIAKILQTAPIEGERFAQAVTLLSLTDVLAVASYEKPETDRAELIAALKKLGYDASKAWDKPKAEKAVPAAKKAAAKKVVEKSALSGAARKRIADAQKKRWAAQKKAGRK